MDGLPHQCNTIRRPRDTRRDFWRCTALQELHLYGTQVADIAPLRASLESLRLIDLTGTKVDDIALFDGCDALKVIGGPAPREPRVPDENFFYPDYTEEK